MPSPLPGQNMIAHTPHVKLCFKNTGPNRRIVVQRAFCFLKRNHFENHKTEQIIGCLKRSRCAEFLLLSKTIHITRMIRQQLRSHTRVLTPGRPPAQNNQRMRLHILRHTRIGLMHLEVLVANTFGALPRMNVNRIAVPDHKRILYGERFSSLHRIHLEYKDPGDGRGGVLERPRSHQNSVALHLLNIRHVRRPDAVRFCLGRYLAGWTGMKEDYVIPRRNLCKTGGCGRQKQYQCTEERHSVSITHSGAD